MAVVVNTHSEQEEKVLLAFLNSLNYDYQTTVEPSLTEEQAKEILHRDAKFINNETTSKPWSAIKQELKNVYR